MMMRFLLAAICCSLVIVSATAEPVNINFANMFANSGISGTVGSPATVSTPVPQVTFAGSDLFTPLIQYLLREYTLSEGHTAFTHTNIANTSTFGIASAGLKTATVGLSTRPFTEDETATFPQLDYWPFAVNAMHIVQNGVVNTYTLTLQQIRDIFTGVTTSWSSIHAGNNAAIKVVIPQWDDVDTFAAQIGVDAAAIRRTASHAAAGWSNAANYVSTEANTITYLPKYATWLTSGTTVVNTIDSVEATAENVMSSTYPLSRTYALVMNHHDTSPANLAALNFVNWCVRADYMTQWAASNTLNFYGFPAPQ